MPTTRCPSARNASARGLPRKPATPVMKMRCFTVLPVPGHRGARAASFGESLAHPLHAHPVLERRARVCHDLVALGQPTGDLGAEGTAVVDLYGADLRVAILHGEDGPSPTLAEDRAGRHLKHDIRRPGEDADLHPKSVAERRGARRVLEIQEHVHALF